MQLKIVTPERVVFEDEADAVFAETVDGEVGILPRHIPMVAPLAISVLRYQKDGDKRRVAVMGGLLRTDGKGVTILSPASEQATEIDVMRAKEAEKRAKERLQEKTTEVDTQRAQLALTRSLTRQKASE